MTLLYVVTLPVYLLYAFHPMARKWANDKLGLLFLSAFVIVLAGLSMYLDYPDLTQPVYHADDGTLTIDEIPHTDTGSQAEAIAFMCQELAQDVKDHPEAYPPERRKHILQGTNATGKFIYVKDQYDKDFADNYVKYIQAYSQDRNSVPLPVRAYFTVWCHDPRVPAAPPGYTPFFQPGQESSNTLPVMKFIKNGVQLRPQAKHITSIPEYIEAHTLVYVACALGLFVMLAQGVRGWINRRILEKWWADNQPEALDARIKSGEFFQRVTTATIIRPGGRTLTGEFVVLRHEEGYPWFRITEGSETEFSSLTGACIKNPLYPDEIILPEGLKLHLHRDESYQRKLERVRELVKAL